MMRTNIGRGGALAAALLVVAALLAACGGGGGSSSNADRALRVAVTTDISSLDPVKGNSGTDHVMLYALYDTLISFDAGLEPKPDLAESWEQVSPTELTLHLREGVTFHDGTAFDAEAVKYNLDRARAEGSNIAADLASVKDVRVDDPMTVTIELSAPDAAILMVLADRAGMMVSPEAAKASGDDVSNNPVGAGGWTYVDWKRGSVLKVKRYDGYWDDDAQRAAAVDFNVITDPKTRVTSLRSGQQDIALGIAPSDAGSLDSASEISLEQSPSLFLHMVYLNTASQEFADPRVRRALSLAVDRDALLSGGYFDRASAAAGFFPEDYWAAPPADVEAPYDPEQAKQLLQEAGAENLTFDMITWTDSAMVRVGEILKDQLAKVGVTVNLQPRELVQGTNDFFAEKETPAFLSAWSGRPDPAMTYRSLLTEGAFYNPGGTAVPGVAEALSEASKSLEAEDRAPGLDAAAEAAYQVTPDIPLVFTDSLIGISKDVQGFENNLLGKPKLLGVTFK